MPMYNLTEYSSNYSKTSGSLWQYYRHKLLLTNSGALENYPGNSALFKFKQKVTGSTVDYAIKANQIMVPSKYLWNFWRTLQMLLINYGINLNSHLVCEMCYI